LTTFLPVKGKRGEFEAVAIKEMLAWQIGEAMKASKLSQNALAQRMRTSRSQVRRLLDPTDGNVTLNTLQRTARIVGRSLPFALVWPMRRPPDVAGAPAAGCVSVEPAAQPNDGDSSDGRH